MSELRDRIAAVLLDYFYDAATPGEATPSDIEEANIVADAVIKELGLFMEYENGRVLYKKKPTSTNFKLWQQRIASEFEPYNG